MRQGLTKLSILTFGAEGARPTKTATRAGGPGYYGGLISNLGTKAVGARIMGVYFPEFEQDWEM
jgi:hypothetical protein